jgi:hypothetical protein
MAGSCLLDCQGGRALAAPVKKGFGVPNILQHQNALSQYEIVTLSPMFSDEANPYQYVSRCMIW